MPIQVLVKEKVFIRKVKDIPTNFYAIECLNKGDRIAQIERTYEDFKIFEGTLINYLKGNQVDFPTLERGIERSTQNGMRISSGERQQIR